MQLEDMNGKTWTVDWQTGGTWQIQYPAPSGEWEIATGAEFTPGACRSEQGAAADLIALAGSAGHLGEYYTEGEPGEDVIALLCEELEGDDFEDVSDAADAARTIETRTCPDCAEYHFTDDGAACDRCDGMGEIPT